MSTDIINSINNYEGGIELQERVVKRLGTCGLVYSLISNDSQAALAGRVNLNASALVSEGIPVQRYEELLRQAADDVMVLHGTGDDYKSLAILWDCLLLNDPRTLDVAVMELWRN